MTKNSRYNPCKKRSYQNRSTRRLLHMGKIGLKKYIYYNFLFFVQLVINPVFPRNITRTDLRSKKRQKCLLMHFSDTYDTHFSPYFIIRPIYKQKTGHSGLPPSFNKKFIINCETLIKTEKKLYPFTRF